jgi:hypothetical protein
VSGDEDLDLKFSAANLLFQVIAQILGAIFLQALGEVFATESAQAALKRKWN